MFHLVVLIFVLDLCSLPFCAVFRSCFVVLCLFIPRLVLLYVHLVNEFIAAKSTNQEQERIWPREPSIEAKSQVIYPACLFKFASWTLQRSLPKEHCVSRFQDAASFCAIPSCPVSLGARLKYPFRGHIFHSSVWILVTASARSVPNQHFKKKGKNIVKKKKKKAPTQITLKIGIHYNVSRTSPKPLFIPGHRSTSLREGRRGEVGGEKREREKKREKTDTQRVTERERQTETERDRQRDRQTEKEREKRDTQRVRERQRERQRQTDRQRQRERERERRLEGPELTVKRDIRNRETPGCDISARVTRRSWHQTGDRALPASVGATVLFMLRVPPSRHRRAMNLRRPPAKSQWQKFSCTFPAMGDTGGWGVYHVPSDGRYWRVGCLPRSQRWKILEGGCLPRSQRWKILEGGCLPRSQRWKIPEDGVFTIVQNLGERGVERGDGGGGEGAGRRVGRIGRERENTPAWFLMQCLIWRVCPCGYVLWSDVCDVAADIVWR